MKKTFALVIVCLFVMTLFPMVSLAADATISADDSNYNLASHSHANGDTITIGEGRTVTLVGDSGTTYTNFKIVCEAGVHLTLSNVNIDDSGNPDACPLSFTGSGNTLVLAAGTTNALAGGDNEPAVRVEDTTELTISGSGTLNVQSGLASAGIGGGRDSNAGTINITGGNITASVYNYLSSVSGAGIGGGAYGGGGGSISISGGTVNATSSTGAGIGGGYQGSAGTVTITGGTVTASCSAYGAGIGPGWEGSGGTVNIMGGTVTASSDWGSGIGGSWGGSGISVNITGGTLTATSNDGYDIGSGKDGGSDGGTLNLDGAAYLTLDNKGTDASVTIGDAYIRDDSTISPVTDGYYVDGVLFTGTVIDMSTGTVTGSGAIPGIDISITDYTRDYLVTGSTALRTLKTFTPSALPVDIILFGTSIKPPSYNALDAVISIVNLQLCGSNELHSNGDYAGLRCRRGAEVTISGDGTLTAESASSGAGIGGNSGEPGGKITIVSGTVNAFGNKNTGYNGGAGIGGGNAGIGGTILISGGTVNAKSEGPHNDAGGSAAIGGGEDGGAGSIRITGGTVTASAGNEHGCGIGCGYEGTGGRINITGGTVTATAGRIGEAGIGGSGDMDITISGGMVQANGRYNGAGIGGDGENLRITISGGTVTATVIDVGAGIGSSDSGTVGQINITGGTVNASGGNSGYTEGAGIGGGVAGSGGSITISGGTVYAKKGAMAPYDIGDGLNGSGTTLSVSGSAAVFLATDSCITPATTHTHLTYTTDTEESYGYSIPSAWTPTFGAFLRLVTLDYNANGGSGTAPASVTQLYNTPVGIADGSGLLRPYYTLNGWNTAADGSGTNYAAGSTFTFAANTTLYAKWLAHPELTSSVSDGKIYTGGRIVLTPNIGGGKWDWNEDYLSATFNSPATFTGLKAGTTTIKYTVEGVSTTYDVTIKESELPSTGQNFTLIYLILAGAVAAGSAALLFAAKREGTHG